ncbi:MAG: hypothetical protein HYW62_03295 [Candidatus Levybacteria bacterium]|nr:hypothetical protein [Candidatus Levybacteria bacterium]
MKNKGLNISHLSSLISHFERGQSLVEIVLAMGLAAILLPALLTGLVSSREGKAQQTQRIQAVYLLNETVDAVRSVREKGWTSFAVNGTFHPVISGSTWTLATGSANINSFTQRVDIEDVQRASSGAIVTSGGSVDPSSKKVDIEISWTQPYASTVSASLFITRYLDNNSFTQTTVADFETGTKSGTVVTNTNGGEVTLGAGGNGDWCKPGQFIVASLDLPKQGVADAITAIEGKTFVGTGDNSSGVSFANVAISNTNPPVPSIDGTFDGYKTNGVFGETDYAYIATDDPHKEVVIIDLRTKDANNKYSEVGFFDAPTNKKGDQVWVLGDVGYMITEKKLYSFDLSSKSGSRSLLDPDGVTVGDGTRVVVVGSYAYVTIKGSNIELQIVDVSNPNNLTIVGQADLTGKDAKDLFVNTTGTRVYLVTGKQDALPEFFIVDTSVKTGNRPVIGSYDANGMDPKAVTVVPSNRAIIVGKEGTEGSEEYQVIDISNESSPVRCGGLNLGDQDGKKINGIAAVLEADGDAYSYIMTGDASSEFKIIEGGPEGAYASSGTFISGVFDSGYSTAFNRFDTSINRPNSTDLQFQIAVSPEVSGNCDGASFSFVGPDATSSTFFTTSETSGVQTFNFAVPININPGQCFKYKAFFSTTDSLSTPIFYDMTGNYSP